MSSVTEAPRWRHEARTAIAEPARASQRIGRLELASADASQLLFLGRRPALAPIFLSPLLLALAGLPWLAPPPRPLLHLGTSLVFGLAATAVAAWARPRRRRVHVVSGDAAPPGARAVQPGSVRWVLDMAQSEGAVPATYTAALRSGDSEQLVLESNDPERLLRQLSEVIRHWPGPVECRWGLPDTARPWNMEPQSGPRPLGRTPARAVLRSPLVSRPLLVCTCVMSALVNVDLIWLVHSASAKLQHVHALSVILPCCLALYLAVLALLFASSGWRLTLGGPLRKERTLFGVTRVLGEVRIDSVRGVYAVGAPGAERWHVLVDSSDGPIAVPVPRKQARSLARQAESAVALARGAGER